MLQEIVRRNFEEYAFIDIIKTLITTTFLHTSSIIMLEHMYKHPHLKSRLHLSICFLRGYITIVIGFVRSLKHKHIYVSIINVRKNTLK